MLGYLRPIYISQPNGSAGTVSTSATPTSSAGTFPTSSPLLLVILASSPHFTTSNAVPFHTSSSLIAGSGNWRPPAVATSSETVFTNSSLPSGSLIIPTLAMTPHSGLFFSFSTTLALVPVATTLVLSSLRAPHFVPVSVKDVNSVSDGVAKNWSYASSVFSAFPFG